MPGILRSNRARQDLIEIWQYVAQDDPGLADALLDTIDAKCNLLLEHPFLGPGREDIRPGMRYLVVAQYVVLYSVDEDAIRIVRVLHGKRDLMGIFVG